MTRPRYLIATVGWLFAACVDGGASSESFHTSYAGPLGWAPVVEIGDTIDGTIGKRQLDLWALDLHTGDEVTVVQNVTDGDLAPEFKLFLGNNSVSSGSFDAQEGGLTKTYKVTAGGRHFIGVRAYQGQGTGSYNLVVNCDAGPCDGAPITEPLLSPRDANTCIKEARECTFENMVQYNGAVGPWRARKLFTDCLESTTIHSGTVGCKQACEGEEATDLCDDVIAEVPWFADQPAECLQEFDRCMDVCYESEGDAYYDMGISHGGEYSCMIDGLNGSCTYYVKDHEYCGGSMTHDSTAQCLEFCESSWGAWSDDLYGSCDEECGTY